MGLFCGKPPGETCTAWDLKDCVVHCDPLVHRLHAWLGIEGLTFFRQLKERYGSLMTVLPPGDPLGVKGIPWPVHFREGMQIRNWLRDQPESKDWSFEDLEARWPDVVELALKADT